MFCVDAPRCWRGTAAWAIAWPLPSLAAGRTVMSVWSPAGPQAQAVTDIGWAMVAGTALLTLLVLGLLWRALRAPARSVRPLRWLVGAGLVLPVAVLALLMGWSQWRARGVMAGPPPDALVVGLTGHMWWWELRYHHPGGGADIVAANEIRVPVGRTVWLGLSSADVIHSVWLPQLAGKMDTVPGRTNRLVFRVDRPGVYRGQCAEFCGLQHARMALHLVAMAPADFEAWLRAQATVARPPATAQQQRGLEAFRAAGCGACHSVRGVVEHGGGPRAPDLTHVGSRNALGAGSLPNTPQAMATWIAGVQEIKAGARMPGYRRLDPATLEDIAAWLSHLR